MKYCADCVHYSKGIEVYESPSGYLGEKIAYLCSRLNEKDIVHKSYMGKRLNCYAEREDAKRLEAFRCGYEGKYWEPK